MKKAIYLILFCALVTGNTAFAHGYTSTPKSRAYFCRLGDNTSCGNIQYEPQSLEAPSGYFSKGLLDGKMGSVGVASARALDEQTASRWTKNSISSGKHKFIWTFTAPHKSKLFRFYLTKQGWDYNQPLTYSDFDPTPLNCSTSSWQPGEAPPQNLEFSCDIPERSGYQVAMAEWEVADTVNSFYNLIDLNFSKNIEDSYPKAIGKIVPQNLAVGDELGFMPYTEENPSASYIHIMTISTAEQGKSSVWPYEYAQIFNKLSITMFNHQILAGEKQLSQDGKKFTVVPTYSGQNLFYTKANSPYRDGEVIIKSVDIPSSKLIKITTPPQSEVVMSKGKAVFHMAFQSSATNLPGTVKVSLFNVQNEEYGRFSYDILAGQELRISPSFPAADASIIVPGAYKLVIIRQISGGEIEQTSYDVKITNNPGLCPAYKENYPYKAGDCVTNHEVQYTCKDWPYTNWCSQKPYAPGELWNGQKLWPMAWNKQ